MGTTDDATPTRSCPFAAKLIDNKRVTAHDHFQDVRLITFDISNSTIRYWAVQENLSCDKSNIECVNVR